MGKLIPFDPGSENTVTEQTDNNQGIGVSWIEVIEALFKISEVGDPVEIQKLFQQVISTRNFAILFWGTLRDSAVTHKEKEEAMRELRRLMLMKTDDKPSD